MLSFPNISQYSLLTARIIIADITAFVNTFFDETAGICMGLVAGELR